MFACFSAHRYEVKSNNVDPSRFDRSKIIGKAELLSAALLRRLARKRKSQPLRSCIVFVNDQIVPAGLAWEVTVNEFRLEQFLTNRLRLYFRELRINSFFKNLCILFRSFLAL